MALAQQFKSRQKNAALLFIGGGLDKNRYFDRKAFDYRTIDCGAFVSKSPWALARSCLYISRGIMQSRQIIRQFNPDAVVGFGSFYSFPPLVAAKWHGVPLILHEANSIPGKVNKLMAPFATATGVHFPKTLDLLKGETFEVGMPLRQGFEKDSIDSKLAKAYFGLQESEEKILLVFGGSQGADIINKYTSDAVSELKEMHPFQIIHITGDEQQVEYFQKKYANLNLCACVKAFEQRMEYAWKAADLVVSRAGASSIAEQLEFEVPGLLIPFAKAADNHQKHNADFLVKTMGASYLLEEKDLSIERLVKLLKSLVANEAKELKRMRSSMNVYKEKMREKDLYWLVNQASQMRALK